MAERRLSRLRRLERVRAVAKNGALAEAARAEAALSQLSAIARRTRVLVDDYPVVAGPGDGLALNQLLRFGGTLRGISRQADGDAVRARAIADARGVELALAERRRAAVGERVTRTEQALRQAVTPDPPQATARGVGTALE